MSIDMYLAQSRNQAASVKNACDQLAADYRSLLLSNNDFIQDTELTGEAYTSAKEFFSAVIQPLVRGGEIFSAMTAAACQQFTDTYEAEVDSVSLRSTDLEDRIAGLEQSIQDIEYMDDYLPTVGMGIIALRQSNQRTIDILLTTKRDLEEKLEHLRSFDASSPTLFSEVDSFAATLAQGLEQARTSFNPSTGTFIVPNGADLEWTTPVQEKYLTYQMNHILDKIPDLAETDWEVVASYASAHPDEEVPQNLKDYLVENQDDIIADLGNDALSNFVEQLGVGIHRFGGLVTVLEGVRGPSGPGSFVMVNPNGIGTKVAQNGQHIAGAGKWRGRGFVVAGFGMGMYDDMANKDKTVGQALSHNTVSTGVGIGGGALGALAVGALVTNPAGWAILGGIAVGTAAGIAFDYAYQSNFLGLQDGLDWTGDRVDEGIDWARDRINDGVEMAKDAAENVGEAIGNVGTALNPMNWAWG